MVLNPYTPTDRFSSFQNNEWKSPLKLLSVERVNIFDVPFQLFLHLVCVTAGVP